MGFFIDLIKNIYYVFKKIDKKLFLSHRNKAEKKMNISNTKDLSQGPIKILIYAPSGAGKTFSAKTIKDKALIISAEAGLLPLADSNIDVINLHIDDNGKPIDLPDRVYRLGQAYDFLCKEKKYDTIFIDSLTEISQIINEFTDKLFPDRKDSLVKWNEYNKKMVSIIKKFRDLPNYNVIFTCLSVIEKDENNKRYTAFSTYGSISNRLAQYFDEVFYLHNVNEDGQIKRFFQTQNENQIISKDRSTKLALYEPVDFNNIFNKMRGPKK